MTWRTRDRQVASIGLLITGDRLVVSYHSTGIGNITECASIDSTECTFGGTRPWLRCPGCDRRVAILYITDRLRCRACHRLTYASRNESSIERSFARASGLRKRIGVGGNRYPVRPAGMHEGSWEGLLVAWESAELEALNASARELEALEARRLSD